MLTLTPEAQEHLDRYLRVVRLSVRGTGLEAAEVEADVREHIASALAGEAAPVERPVLERVLERVGPPEVWVPDDELPAWRRTLRRLLHGPEDWRLSYLSFGLFVLGLVTTPVGGAFLQVAAYFPARGAHAVARERGVALGARRWLVYPPLVLMALSLGLVLVVGPVPPVAVWGIAEEGFLRLAGAGPSLSWTRELAVYAAGTAVALGAWWLLVAVIAGRHVAGVRSLLLPLAERLERRHFVGLGAVGALFAAGGLAVLAL